MTMDARKQRVLQAIVALYGLEGEPVGSSVLANYFDMAVSSATLRNEMAALTKLGLLEQPHTSAGRVPSAKGYRTMSRKSWHRALPRRWPPSAAAPPPSAPPAPRICALPITRWCRWAAAQPLCWL